MIKPSRTAVKTLGVSASAVIGVLLAWEGFTTTAIIPVPGDVPTIAAGHTGPDVKLGDKITVQRGMVLLLEDANEAAAIVKSCAPVDMYQWEFDAYMSLALNIGHGKVGKDGFCINKEGKRAIIPRKLLVGDYKGACEAILLYNKFKGKPLKGLTNRRNAEYQLCITNPESAPSLDTGSVAFSGSGT